MLEQSIAVSAVYCSKGHNNYDFSTRMKSKTNVVSMSAGLNEATCVIKSQFVCAVKYKQAAVGMKKKRLQESSVHL